MVVGWAQRFDRCEDHLILRVGGPGGSLICWPDRGKGGRFTWSADDPIGEIRDLTPWVGNASRVRLFAVILQAGSDEAHFCEMVTLFDDTICRQWQFDSDQDYDVERPF